MTYLLLDTALTKEQEQFTKTVKSSADSLLAIINDILDFSKIEAGQFKLEPIEFDLGAMIDEMGNALKHLASDKKLKFICPSLPLVNQRITADPGRLRQVLINLMGNAIKFTDKGEVSLSIDINEKHGGKKN